MAVASMTKAQTPVNFSISYSQCSSLQRNPHSNLKLKRLASSTVFISCLMAASFLVIIVKLSFFITLSRSILLGGPESLIQAITFPYNLLSNLTNSSAPEYEPKLMNFLAQALPKELKWPQMLVELDISTNASISCCLKMEISSPFQCVQNWMAILGFGLDWILYLNVYDSPAGMLTRKDSFSLKVSENFCSSLNYQTMKLGSYSSISSCCLAYSAIIYPFISVISLANKVPSAAGCTCPLQTSVSSARVRTCANLINQYIDKYKHIIQLKYISLFYYYLLLSISLSHSGQLHKARNFQIRIG